MFGNLECLKYAHENGSAWNETTCEKAAENGHLECLKYAHGNGCAWDEKTMHAAVKFYNCFKYALSELSVPHFTCYKAGYFGYREPITDMALYPNGIAGTDFESITNGAASGGN